jgi:hypothetical protein
MAKLSDDLGKLEAEKGERDKRSWVPCKYCPLSLIGCPMSRVFWNFQR